MHDRQALLARHHLPLAEPRPAIRAPRELQSDASCRQRYEACVWYAVHCFVLEELPPACLFVNLYLIADKTFAEARKGADIARTQTKTEGTTVASQTNVHTDIRLAVDGRTNRGRGRPVHGFPHTHARQDLSQ